MSTPHTDGETFRVPLVQATQIVGAFGSVTVKHKAGTDGGKCHEDVVSSTDATRGSLSVLVTAQQVKCKSNRVPILITIVVLSVVGGTAIIIGLLWVFRNAAMTWARKNHDRDFYLV